MNIRLATQDDLPRVNELRAQVSALHVAGKPEVFRPGFCEELQDHVHTLFSAADHAILVAEGDGGIVGFACVKLVDRPGSPYRLPQRYLDVDEFGVDEAVRRQGIGRALFDAVRDYARAQGVHRIELNMWEFNREALAFYEAIGFATYRRYMEYRID
ncbi:MAG: GNAT family N-acetyltransferase [Clostridia bacterium]|nr:GNAT family N-acetyltransferase [Clostridia bacterium]